jgi:hypothetical protein
MQSHVIKARGTVGVTSAGASIASESEFWMYLANSEPLAPNGEQA